MIKEEIYDFIGKLMDKTLCDELNWLPAKEFFDNRTYSSNAISELQLYTYCDWAILYNEDSYYLQNNQNQFLFLLHSALESGKDGSLTDCWGLYAILDLDDDMYVTIPDYHPDNEEDRLKKISKIIKDKKRKKEEKEEKRLLEFFNSFF